MKMPFGKHRGEDIHSLPINYLRWLVRENVLKSPDLRAEAERVLKAYDDMDAAGWAHTGGSWRNGGYQKSSFDEQQQHWKTPPPPPPPPPRSVPGLTVYVQPAMVAMFGDLVESGFRALCKKLHPDVGGTAEQMRELNELRTQLRAQIEMHV